LQTDKAYVPMYYQLKPPVPSKTCCEMGRLGTNDPKYHVSAC